MKCFFVILGLLVCFMIGFLIGSSTTRISNLDSQVSCIHYAEFCVRNYFWEHKKLPSCLNEVVDAERSSYFLDKNGNKLHYTHTNGIISLSFPDISICPDVRYSVRKEFAIGKNQTNQE